MRRLQSSWPVPRARRRGCGGGASAWVASCGAAAVELLMLSVGCNTQLKTLRHPAAVEAVSSFSALAAGVPEGLNTLPLTTLPDWPGGEDKQRSPGGEQLPG